MSGFVITIRVPIEAYKKSGVDRDKFLETVKKTAKQFIPNAEVEVVKGMM